MAQDTTSSAPTKAPIDDAVAEAPEGQTEGYRLGYQRALLDLVQLGNTWEGARRIWRLWYEGMMTQGRDVAQSRSAWIILAPKDKDLDLSISRRFVEWARDQLLGTGGS